ncbi:MAG TPA: hypothetical protein VFP32_03390, partial [Candidatus Saccharimonadales bacterium]|nr:hypothetical protein [Candidatus Saccharimonadales bacterium]
IGVTMLGYAVGTTVPDIDRYFFPVIIIGLVLIYVFVFWRVARSPARRAALKKGLKEDYSYFFKGHRQ